MGNSFDLGFSLTVPTGCARAVCALLEGWVRAGRGLLWPDCVMEVCMLQFVALT